MRESRFHGVCPCLSPSFAALLHKLDPDDSEKILDYFKTNVLLIREKARKTQTHVVALRNMYTSLC